MADVVVVGCGLIGTSIGLALRASRSVALHDLEPATLSEAVKRGAGEAWDGSRAPLAVIAVPPRATAATLLELQRRDIAMTYTHVSSVQSHVQAEIEALSPDPTVVVGGHPLAGRELSGPGAAVHDLFVGRPWAVCATAAARESCVEAVAGLAQACGAVPVRVPADVHDRAVALLSHLPQVAASGLAGLLSAPDLLPEGAMALAGPGLVDTTRLAAADARLWTQILSLNAQHVLPPLRRLAADLTALADALEQVEAGEDGGLRSLTGFLLRGNVGRGRIPVKRGATADAFAVLRVELDDEPRALARLLMAVGERGVNVEDVRVEHVPGRRRGVVELMLDGDADDLVTPLTSAGWAVLTGE